MPVATLRAVGSGIKGGGRCWKMAIRTVYSVVATGFIYKNVILSILVPCSRFIYFLTLFNDASPISKSWLQWGATGMYIYKNIDIHTKHIYNNKKLIII
jgi:hypothetical protein